MELLCTGGWKLSANGLRDWGGVGKAGYGKDGKLSCAFHFPTTPAAATDTESIDVAGIPILSKTFPGAKAKGRNHYARFIPGINSRPTARKTFQRAVKLCLFKAPSFSARHGE